jgi:hypothetical protein
MAVQISLGCGAFFEERNGDKIVSFLRPRDCNARWDRVLHAIPCIAPSLTLIFSQVRFGLRDWIECGIKTYG